MLKNWSAYKDGCRKQSKNNGMGLAAEEDKLPEKLTFKKFASITFEILGFKPFNALMFEHMCI